MANGATMENAIVPIQFGEYAIAQYSPPELIEALTENLGGAEMGPFGLDRIKIPAGGMTMWTKPSIEGDQHLDALTGVIIFWEDVRSYWSSKMDEGGGGNPPNCVGVRNDAGEFVGKGARWEGDGLVHPCMPCPKAEFVEGRGSECKMTRRLYLLLPGDALPIFLQVPATSQKVVREHMKRLASAMIPYYGAVTTFTLEKAKSASGIAYSTLALKHERKLGPEEMALAKTWHQTMAAQLKSKAPSAFDGDPGTSFENEVLEEVNTGIGDVFASE